MIMWNPPSEKKLQELQEMAKQLCVEFPNIEYDEMYDMVLDGFYGLYALSIEDWRNRLSTNKLKKIEDKNMTEFFDSIKNWEAAAKLSSKVLSVADLGYTTTKSNGNEYNN